MSRVLLEVQCQDGKRQQDMITCAVRVSQQDGRYHTSTIDSGIDPRGPTLFAQQHRTPISGSIAE